MSKTEMPSAHITVNSGRKKVKEVNNVYLNNGQEFEIELFNPTTNIVLTKIKINNNSISSGGIILRPGERIYLERYIDTPKKFLFDTYEVGGGSSEQKAILKNGLIEVEFFNEDISQYSLKNSTTIIRNYNTYNSPYLNQTTPYCANNNLQGSSINTMMGIGSTNSLSVETGRVEQGSNSNQTFETLDKKFFSFSFEKVIYHLKPTSTEPKTTTEVLTKYCTECGKKAKPSNKFCSNCGTKL